MSILSQLGWRVVAGKPNAQGYCMFTIVDSDDCEIAEIDRPCTLEEALSAARRLAEKELEEDEKE